MNKLNKLKLLDNIEYYQFVKIGIYKPNTVGDLFTDWRDIPMEREKFIRQCKND